MFSIDTKWQLFESEYPSVRINLAAFLDTICDLRFFSINLIFRIFDEMRVHIIDNDIYNGRSR